MSTQTFEEAVAEFIEKSKELLEQESDENLPPLASFTLRSVGPAV